jgi:predicted O-methyltransferase YrrM
MGLYARQKALAHTIQNNAYKWKEVYESLAGDWADQLTRTAIVRGALQKPPEFSGFLRFLSEQKPLTTIVEIGTAQGGTFGALCEMGAKDATLISIDLPGGDFGGTDDVYGERDYAKIKSYAKPGQKVECIRANSQHQATKERLLEILDGRGIDLLFIDGDHSYTGVRKDFELYEGLAAGGIVGFHDILQHTTETRSEVHRLWAELKEQYDTREFTDLGYDWGWGQWGGIGVILK